MRDLWSLFLESFPKILLPGLTMTIPLTAIAFSIALVIAVIVAVIIVLAMNLVGSLLISALIIFPALSAMRVHKTFLSVTICSAILSVACALAGLLVSILGGTPVGSTIVAVNAVAFGIFSLIGRLKGGVSRG